MVVSPAFEIEPIYGIVYLPRKFKIGFALPEDNCIEVYANDLGFLAVHENGKVIGYNALVGGSMGQTPSRQDTFPAVGKRMAFVTPDQLIDVATAIVGVQRDNGNRVDRNHVGGQVVNRTEQQCHTTTSTSQSSHVVGYEVTYRNPDGTTGTMRTDSKPGDRIALGVQDVPVAYDVTYRYDGQERTVRLPERPVDNRIPVVDGQVVAQVDTSAGNDRQ